MTSRLIVFGVAAALASASAWAEVCQLTDEEIIERIGAHLDGGAQMVAPRVFAFDLDYSRVDCGADMSYYQASCLNNVLGWAQIALDANRSGMTPGVLLLVGSDGSTATYNVWDVDGQLAIGSRIGGCKENCDEVDVVNQNCDPPDVNETGATGGSGGSGSVIVRPFLIMTGCYGQCGGTVEVGDIQPE